MKIKRKTVRLSPFSINLRIKIRILPKTRSARKVKNFGTQTASNAVAANQKISMKASNPSTSTKKTKPTCFVAKKLIYQQIFSFSFQSRRQKHTQDL